MDNFQINWGSLENIAPIQLISFTESKEISIHEDAISFFSKLTDVNFATVAVVGKYRTGKSYLLNRVLLDRSDGFSVGPTINPCTKGLWIWPSLIEVTNNQQKTKILVIDTEGIGAYNEEENHDIKIFLVAMLLSSYFVYNSVGNIDEMAIQNLSLIINLGKHLQKSNEKEFDDLISVFPNFLWVVRDFALKLLDPSGNPITSKEYLENALKAQKGMSETAENKNRIRRLITSFFKERDCAMLVRPLQNESEIQNLSKIPFSDLRPEFVNQVLNLRRKIFAKIKPKSFKGKLVNGNTFIQMCKIFCDSINKGEIPSIQNSWNSVCKLECQRLVYSIIENYTSQMDDVLKKQPVEFSLLNEKHKELKKSSLTNFGKNSFGDEKPFYNEELVKGIKLKYQEYLEKNTEAFQVVIKEFFENRYLMIVEEMENNQINSLTQIEEQISKLKSDLESQFSNASQVLNIVNSLLIDAVLGLTQKFTDKDKNKFKTHDIVHEGRLKSLEDKIESLQNERENNARLLTDKMMELETQKSNYIFQHKKQLEKKDKQLEEKIKENEGLRRDLNETKQELTSHLNEKEKFKKGKEEKEISIQMMNIEFNKKFALIQQKNQFLEKETANNKEKISDLEEVIKILKENLENLSTEKLELEQKVFETNKAQYEILQKDYAILETKHKELLKEKERLLNNWKMEKEYLGKELLIAKSQLEENKKNNDLILKTLSTSRKMNTEHSSEHSGAMIKANKNLSVALEKTEARCSALEKKIEKLNGYQKAFKHCSNLECKLCLKWYTFESFQMHFSQCQKAAFEELQAISLEVKYEATEENKFKKEFDIEVSYQKKSWNLKKTFKTLRHWANELAKFFPKIKTRPFFLSFATKIKNPSKKNNKQEYFESKRLQIAKFLDEICKITEIKNSMPFETFLAIDIHIKKQPKNQTCESSDSSQSSFIETEKFEKVGEPLHQSSRLDRTVLSNKENLEYKDLSSDKKAKKKFNDSRTSLKNISFKDLFNDVNSKLSSSSKNNFGVIPFSNKTNVISSNKHLNLLNMKTPRSTAFYSTNHVEEKNYEKTIIKSPLNIRESEFKEHL